MSRGLDFAAPDRLGGVRPVGRLVQQSTTVYFVGLFAYTLVGSLPAVTSVPGPRPGPFLWAVFLAAWAAGFALFLLPTLLCTARWGAGSERGSRRSTGGWPSTANTTFRCRMSRRPTPMCPGTSTPLALERAERTREYPTDARLVRDLLVGALPSLATSVLAALA